MVMPYPRIAPCSSSVVGSRSRPPAVVAEKSPMACTELITNSSPMATQAEISKLIPKCMMWGSWNIPASPTLVKLTIPKNMENMYPAIMPIRMEASFKKPLAK